MKRLLTNLIQIFDATVSNGSDRKLSPTSSKKHRFDRVEYDHHIER